MANCQNQLRYGQQNMNRQQRPMRGGYGMPSRSDANCEKVEATACAASRQEQCGCAVAADTCGCETLMEERCGVCEERQERETREAKEARRERRKDKDCGCGHKDKLAGLPLAMAYVPWQEWGDLYCAHKALQVGTVFEELNMPFLGRGGCNR